MTPVRYNAFSQIHKGLRALLYDTSMAIQHTDFARQEEAQVTFNKIEKVLWLFDGHAHVEDGMVFPLLQEKAPDIVDSFEKEHVKDHQLGEDLVNIMAEYTQQDNPVARLQTGFRLSLAFQEFTAFNLQHMNREETVVNQALWEHYTDLDLLAMQQRIVAAIPPEKNELYTRWMLRGNNDAELLYWFGGLQKSVPEFAFQHLCQLASVTIPERWAGIQEKLAADVAA